MRRMAVGPVGPGCCGRIRPRRNCRDAGALIPETATKLLQPLRIFHQEWVDERIAKLTYALTRFKERRGRSPAASPGRFWCRYPGLVLRRDCAEHEIPSFAELAVIVPVSFIVQMIPLS